MYKKRLGIILTMGTMALVSACASAESALKDSSESANSPQGKPLKVYILAGQSNMQGKGAFHTVKRMALSPKTKALHDRIVDENGAARTNKNVSIVYFTGGDRSKGKPRPLKETKGLLSKGFGSDIGPELGFGITIDDNTDGPILIIKAAWGGRSLFHHFRPPSASVIPYVKQTSFNKTMTAEEKAARNREKEEEHNKTQGLYYRLIVDLVKKVLADPGQYCDAYDPKQGYEIAGFGWFQGYNDMIAGGFEDYKPKDGRPQFAGHTDLLAHFIRDIRKDLDAPKMPFVIGVEGIGGEKPNDTFRAAQAATAELPEFKGNVVAVETAPFWDTEVEVGFKRVKKSEKTWEESKRWQIVGTPKPEDRIWNYRSFNLDTEKQYKVHNKWARDFLFEVPADMKDWLNPEFDTSTWKKGPAPVGKGVSKRAEENKLVRSKWGDGNMLLMKTTFTLDRDKYADFRLCLRTTRSFHAYLNGELIKTKEWYSGAEIRKWDIDAKAAKQGVNELAFYGNIAEHKGGIFNAVDLYLEALSNEDSAELKKQQNDVASPLDHTYAGARANQEYHYLGSAYTYSQIGEALAKAVIDMEKKAE